MKKVPVNFALNLTAFYLLVLLIASGLLIKYVLLPGSQGGRGLAMLGMTRHEWGNLHFYLSLGFIAAMLLHVILHWSWIRATFSRFLSAKSVATMGLILISTILILASPFLIPLQKGVEEEGERGGQGRRGQQQEIQFPQNENTQKGTTPLEVGDLHIRGFMTLADVEALSGMPVARIVQALHLPESTSSDQKIGPLLRTNNLEMDALRKVVYSYMGIESPAEH